MTIRDLDWKRGYGLVLTSLSIVAVRVLVGVGASKIGGTFIVHRQGGRAMSTGLVSSLTHWDAHWYIGIARHGYPTLRAHAFYPAYPALIRLVSPVFGYSGGALVIAWVAAVFAVWGVIDVTSRFTRPETALMAGLLFVWNPASIFLMAAYPEGLLVALMIWSLRFALDRRWWPAALLAGVASCVLPQGTITSLAVVLGVLVAEPSNRRFAKALLVGVIGEVGLISYVIFCWATTGNPLVIPKAESVGWHNQFTYPFHVVLRQLVMIVNSPASGQVRSVYVLNACAGILGGAMAAIGLYLGWRERRLLLPAVLLALGVLVSVLTIDIGVDSTARFILFQAPLYVIGAVIADRLGDGTRTLVTTNVLVISTTLAVLYGAMYNFGWWLT
ncbi:MAG: hypothetical protein HKL86_06390 [Acidimicrobiaceae bacterium]|nr:hypothetical protein [Acidimicrobiaceae bacterium]